MNTHSLTRHNDVSPAVTQSQLKLQSTASKTSSNAFQEFLTANLQSGHAPSATIARQSPVVSQNPAPVVATAQTPGQTASQPSTQIAPPPVQPTEPITAPVYTGEYMEQLTYNGFVNQANLQNQNTADQYQLNLSNWELNDAQEQSLGLPTQPPPAAPQYVAVNTNGFDQWWASLNNYGDPAPVTFIDPISS